MDRYRRLAGGWQHARLRRGHCDHTALPELEWRRIQPGGLGPNTDDRISWVVLKASPVANEMLLGVYASATRTLFVLTWNGSAWISNWSVNMNLNESYRGFDIAYERNSGDAVVVFSDQATHTLKYRKRVSGAWDASDQTIATLDDEANWVRPNRDPRTMISSWRQRATQGLYMPCAGTARPIPGGIRSGHRQR